MKSFITFTFGFLYTRNWHTGQRELSRSRLAVFCGGLFLLAVSLLVISILQTPFTVENEPPALR